MNVNLQHPVPVTLRQLLRGSAPQDDDYRETIQGAQFGPEVVAPGQVKWVESRALDVTRIGTQDDSDGYVVFLTASLKRLGVTLSIGDKFVRFGVGANQVVREVYITRLAPFAHYQSSGGAACVKAYFADRQPSRGV